VDTQPNVDLVDTDLPSARAIKPQLMEKVGNIDILIFFKEYAKDPNIPYNSVATKLGMYRSSVSNMPAWIT
jgi:hypothetical protein